MDMSKKALIIIIVLAVAGTAFAMAVWANIGGLGTKLAGVGGPVGNTIYNGLNSIPTWISRGGWPTLAVGILTFCLLLPGLVAYACWHYDIPYKFTGNPNSTGSGSYQSAPSQNIIPIDQGLQDKPKSS
jgi:hypothetical protein